MATTTSDDRHRSGAFMIPDPLLVVVFLQPFVSSTSRITSAPVGIMAVCCIPVFPCQLHPGLIAH